MEITIQNIKRIGVTNLIILGLVACSSTPAPWTQEDESPWGAKREAEASAVSASTSSDTSLNDPVLLADPEPEPIVMQEPEAAPAPEVIVPVVVEDTPATQDIMAMLSSNYAVQVFAAKNVESIDKFKTSKDVGDLMTVKTDRSGEIVYVLVDIYPDRASADAAAVELEKKTGSKPWVRSLAGLQKIATQ
jgi:septal ring-binding cell division protein DamX